MARIREKVTTGPMTVAVFKFDEDFLVEAFRRYRRQHRARWVFLGLKVGAILLVAAVGGWALHLGNTLPGVVFLSLSLLLCFVHRVDDWWVRRALRKSPYADEVLRVEMDETSYRVTSPKQDVKLQWSVFTRVVHFPDGVLIFQGPRVFNWIPVTALVAPADRAGLETLVRSKIRPHQVIGTVAGAGVPGGKI